MLRPLFCFAAIALSVPAFAQDAAPAEDCRVRMDAAPSTWMIEGYDPFGGSLPEGTFGVTFTNEGGSECRFAPVFQLNQPPFGLSRGMGNRVGYAVLNLTDTQDATPRAGRTQRTLSQREVVLAPNESRTILYKLVADPDDLMDAGTFTQDVTLEAQDARLRVVGGTRLVMGVTVLRAARLGLSGEYVMNDGRAVVNLGELQEGAAPIPLQLTVSSTGRYEISVTSANSGRLRLGATEWYVPYAVTIGQNTVRLAGTDTFFSPAGHGARRDSLPIRFTIGDVDDRRAGTYSDVISISVAAR